MINIINSSKEQLTEYLSQIKKEYDNYKSQNLKLDMSRGKPSPVQLELSNDMANCDINFKAKDGTDCRNYGGLDGISEAKELFSELIGVTPGEIIIGGNSSLNLMYDTVVRAMLFGTASGSTPWSKQQVVKFLCPSPGYDRHFAICEQLGIEMITVEMTSNGPDMDQIETLVASDDSIKGIWCVPKYSNPDGITYSDEVVERLAKLKPKAQDFRIFWDNAYAVHDLYDNSDNVKNILQCAKEAGNDDIVYIFSSTSKISFAGAGISLIASSEKNINWFKKLMAIQTIGPDKVNQLRHVTYFKSAEGIKQHMKKHADILRPKFEMVLDILEKELTGLDIAWWNKPRGGYFVSLNTLDGCAKRVVSLAKEAGVTLTPAGATYPYGNDPRDRNIRIAPSFPNIDELKKSMELLCLCVKLASVEKLL